MMFLRSLRPFIAQRRSLVVAAVAAALVLVAATSARAGSEGTQAVRWVGDLGTAKQLSERTGKPMLIVFGAEWCGYCTKLNDDTLSHPQVSRYINEGFVPVHLDLDEQKWAAKILEVRTLPCSVVLAPNADQLGRIVGYEEPSPFFQKLSAARRVGEQITQTSAAR